MHVRQYNFKPYVKLISLFSIVPVIYCLKEYVNFTICILGKNCVQSIIIP